MNFYGHLNSTPFGKKLFEFCLNKSRAEEVPVTGMKIFTHLVGLSDAVELYFVHHMFN